ncbi:MAG: hypothetical protein IPQ07_40025 [Myxococcales bacterium]|nr:hypothetical protein [Myxococcales bacterium]
MSPRAKKPAKPRNRPTPTTSLTLSLDMLEAIEARRAPGEPRTVTVERILERYLALVDTLAPPAISEKRFADLFYVRTKWPDLIAAPPPREPLTRRIMQVRTDTAAEELADYLLGLPFVERLALDDLLDMPLHPTVTA